MPDYLILPLCAAAILGLWWVGVYGLVLFGQVTLPEYDEIEDVRPKRKRYRTMMEDA